VRDWCDDQTTGAVESCGVQLAQSLSAAIRELTELQGADWREWRWGAAHLAWGEHRPFTSVGLLSPFFTVAVESAGGSYTLLRGRTDFREPNPYANVHASAYRAIYDLAEPDKSVFIVSTGQSGHFLSPHYRDLAEKWARAEYVPMTTKRADYEAAAEGVWTLHPGR
jgi:penicillin amidase